MIIRPTLDAPEAVQNGLRYLDEHHADWRDHLSTESLDITSNYECPLAQASQESYMSAVFGATDKECYSTAAIDWAQEHGFCAAAYADDDQEGGDDVERDDARDDPSWPLLQRAWLDALADGSTVVDVLPDGSTVVKVIP